MFNVGTIYDLIRDTGKLNLDAAEFVDAILQDGSSGMLWRGLPCPCARIDTHMARIDCAECKGIGYVYPESMRAPIMFLDTSRQGSLKVHQAGLMASGTIVLSIAPCLALGPGDLIRPDDDVHVVSERLWHRKTRTTESLMRPYRTNRQVPIAQTPGRAPRLLYPEATTDCIQAVVYFDDNDKLIIARPGSYTVDSDGTFRWATGEGPPAGRGWTVRYQAPASYMIQGTAPVLRHQSDERQPWRAVAQRYDRVSRDDP